MNNPREEIQNIIDSVKAYIELERASGCGELFSALTAARVDDEWQALANEVMNCERCGLHKTRKNVVLGAGDTRAKLMFVGEAPGEEEDLKGLPFVGRAGQLLTKIIEAMGLKRSDVYIANILKCRPPGNRAPLPAEIMECEGNLKKQIALIRPKVICALGKSAAQALLRTDESISSLRGRFRDYGGIKLMPTFHPAYLLRNPGDKKLVWQDMKKVLKELGS